MASFVTSPAMVAMAVVRQKTAVLLTVALLLVPSAALLSHGGSRRLEGRGLRRRLGHAARASSRATATTTTRATTTTTVRMAAADRIAVIGGGIGGAALALALQQRGVAVRVFERDRCFACPVACTCMSVCMCRCRAAAPRRRSEAPPHLQPTVAGQVLRRAGAGLRPDDAARRHGTEAARAAQPGRLLGQSPSRYRTPSMEHMCRYMYTRVPMFVSSVAPSTPSIRRCACAQAYGCRLDAPGCRRFASGGSPNPHTLRTATHHHALRTYGPTDYWAYRPTDYWAYWAYWADRPPTIYHAGRPPLLPAGRLAHRELRPRRAPSHVMRGRASSHVMRHRAPSHAMRHRAPSQPGRPQSSLV